MTEPTLERAMGAAREHFEAGVRARLELDPSYPVATAVAVAMDATFEHILSPIIEFLRDVEAHNEWETTVLDVRTVAGSWRDARGYFEEVTGNE